MNKDYQITNNRSTNVCPWAKAQKVGKATAIATPGMVTGIALAALALLFIMPTYLTNTPLAPAAHLLMVIPTLSTAIGILLLSAGGFIAVVSGCYLRDEIRKSSRNLYNSMVQ